MLKFGHENVLAALQTSQIIDVGHRTYPIARRCALSLKWLHPGLVPEILSIRGASNPVLNVIFPFQTRLPPRVLRCLTIVGVDRFHPTQPQASVETYSGKSDPLRTGPSTVAVGSR